VKSLLARTHCTLGFRPITASQALMVQSPKAIPLSGWRLLWKRSYAGQLLGAAAITPAGWRLDSLSP